MDRLAESSRPALTNRSEAIDFTRTQAARTERRDDVEARADERTSDRERLERAKEKPEPFARHLEAQRPAFEPQATGDSPAGASAQPADEPNAEQANAEAKAQPESGQAPSPRPVPPPADAPSIPLIEASGDAPPAAIEASAKPEALHATAPITPVPQPVAVPVALNAAQPTSAPAPGEIVTAVATVTAETSTPDAESTTTNLGVPRADHNTSQVQGQSRNPETPAEPITVEAPRETPAARSAHEVERAADILRQIRVQLTPELSEARIQLQPIELGRVSIHLKLEDGRMKTVVRAEKSETLQAIQTHLPELRASLRQHGIDAQDFQLLLGFENRRHRDADQAPTQAKTRTSTAEVAALERSPALHAAVSQTGVDFYA